MTTILNTVLINGKKPIRFELRIVVFFHTLHITKTIFISLTFILRNVMKPNY